MLLFTYLAALFGIVRKVWLAPDRLAALGSLTAAERFVLLATCQIVLAVVKTSGAL